MTKTMQTLMKDVTDLSYRLIQLNQPRLMKAAAELTGKGLIRSVVVENAHGHLSMILTLPTSDYTAGFKVWDGYDPTEKAFRGATVDLGEL